MFNASSITTNGSSLNDHLLAGPKLQTDLASVILHWRNYKYVFVADIAKMYRQIRVDDRDIDFQRILWRDTQTDQILDYQLLTVTYGMACAPFLALRVLQQLVSDEGQRFLLAARVLRNNIYVDDLLFGANDLAFAKRTREELIALLQCGRFELQKWASNSATFLADIDEADHGLACHKTLAPDDHLKILGVGWTPARDVFEYRVSLTSEIPTTKRSILSAIAKLYDPMGWVTPVLISAKIFMQLLWRANLGWDELISETLLNKWTQIYSRFSYLNGVQIKRWTNFDANLGRVELHGFADASNEAYCSVPRIHS